MKKITSFLMMLLLCCTSVFAQGATEYVDKLIRIGTVQTEMVPGKWYFLHTPRNPNQSVTYDDYAIDSMIQAKGGLVYDNGEEAAVSATTVIEELCSEEGVSSRDYLKMLVRFVAVEGQEGAYSIQFGTGNWIGHNDGGNYTQLVVVNNNNYIAGNAGKFNFYLPAIDGTPNSVGRFAWNKYNMANRIDNNGAGNTVVYYSEGEITQESEGWTTEEEIGGNKIWEIFDVVVLGDVDKWREAFDDILNDYTNITRQGDGTIIDQLIAGENVGNKPGNYRPEDVQAFLALHAQVEELMMLAEEAGSMDPIMAKFPTPEDLKAFNDRYVAAWDHLIENKVPLAMTGIEPGYYTFNSCLYWYTNKSDSVFYTQEEADSINNVLVEEGYTEADSMFVAAGGFKEMASSQVAAPKKSLYSKFDAGTNADWAAWGTQEPNAAFLWKVEAVEGKPTEYRMINMLNGKTHVSIGQSSNSRLALDDTATVCFDWRNDSEQVRYMDGNEERRETVTSFNIRSSNQPENAYNYLQCGSHSNGVNQNGWIVGWSDGGATRWYMTPVDEATANQWISESEGPKTLQAMITKGDSIAAAFPAQLEIAKDQFAEIDETKPVANAENFLSPFTCTSEGDVAQLFDGITNDVTNFWHSEWNSGSTNAYSTTNGTNYFVINDAEGLINGGMAIVIGRRPASNDHVAQLTVYGTNEDYDGETALAALKDDVTNDGYTWTELGALNTPWSTNNAEIVTSNAIEFEGQYKFYKFVATHTVGSNYTDRGFFHMGEFQLYPATISKRFETTQYDARKTEAEALAEAVAVWNERGYTDDDVALLEDEEFQQAYANLVAAAEAWGAVYVDPAALRAAIAAAPADELFVTGNNPGQWKEGTATPAAAVAAAIAYNASGAYTPAQSEAHIAAILNAETATFDSANKVETGKWYRFNFATEEIFEKFGWDKAGAKAVEHEAAGVETQPALFGKTLAIGKKFTDYVGFVNEYEENDTIAVNSVEEKEEWFEGDNLCFFEDADFSNGEDLFRFIQATDSSFMIQNKATGLFLRAGYPVQLSAVPSYFSVQAMGAGANLIASANVLGGDEQGYSYLHAERPTSTLTTWDNNRLGSNSMIFIEEVEPVTEEPSTQYRAKLWPGQVYAYTYPVDVTISEGATAYAAGLAVTGNGSTVVLQPMENTTIKAGTPFVMIANPALAKDQERAGEYISSADRLKQIASEILAENGQYGLNEKALANVRLNDEYAIVTMNHGMTVSTNVDANYSLRGTMEQTSVVAGKAILPNENGFGHTIVNKPVAAYGAWIASDFNPETEEVFANISIMIGEIGDSIVTPDTPDDEGEVPMEEWNFTEWYDPGEGGLCYELDIQHRLARARLKLEGRYLSMSRLDVPSSITYNNREYSVVAMGYHNNYPQSRLDTLALPSSIKCIDSYALEGEYLHDIIMASEDAPVVTGEQPIDLNRLKVTIPNGSLNSYRLANWWSQVLLVQQTPVEISLALSAPGELRYKILEQVDYLHEVNKLTITSGTLNITDWNALSTMTNLMELDIEACANTFIPDNQFSYSHLETVKLPAGLKEIKLGAFQYSHRLASVVIPDSVTYIHGNAFHYCSSLKDVVLNEGLTEIDYGAFYMCDITSLTIPSTVKRINNDAFAYNYRLKELNLNEGLECIIHNAFNECDSLTEVVLPSTLTMCYIPFANCDNLTSLTSNALIPAGTDNNCPVSGVNMADVVLKVPVWSLDEYKFAPGWSQIPQIVASEYQPENVVISKDFTLRIKESEVDASYRPNVALKWSDVWSYDNHGNGYYERGNLTVAPGAMLNANSFSMFYSPLGQYYDNPDNWDGQREYNTNSLLVQGSMRAADVTITLMNQNSAWQFISFPFDVRMSDIVPLDPNTFWVIREYSGAERASGNMEATWTDLDANDVLKAGKGYIMHCHSENGEPAMFQVKADRTSVTRQNIFTSSDNEVMLEEHIAEFEHNSSWNLIGNPYPCYYDIRRTDFTAPVTVWDSYHRNYVAYSPLDDDYVLYPGEAFFVQRPVEQESIVFYADGRQTDRYAREMANARKSAATGRKVYNIVLKGEKTADRTRVVLNEKASMAYEMNYDASKFDAMSRDASQIFTMAGNARMAINERPMGSGIVELGVVIASEGVYTIALKQAGEKKVVLEDRKLGVCTVLSADNEYTFSAVPGEAKGRFFLNFDESATGIDGIGAGQTNKEPAYNTAGVRVEDGQKGLVIKEGKKIVNK